MNLKIISSTKELFDGEIQSVYIPTIGGIIGILENHENLITVIDVGELRYTVDGKEIGLIISGGFAKITDGNVYILADEAEMNDELVKEEINEAIKLAEEKLGTELESSDLIQLEKQLRYQKLKEQRAKS